MGQMLTLTAEDGFQLAAYRATPQGKPRGGLVVIQEIFGVNSHIKQVTDGFAADGYVALAPAIFDRAEPGFAVGYKQEDIELGRAVRAKIPIDDCVKDVRAAVQALRAEGVKVEARSGRCPQRSVACAIGYYGGGIADTAQERPKCPVVLHFGETDQSIPKEHHQRIQAAHPSLPMHVYPAGHGFNCDERGSYHEPSATLARRRTLDALQRHLG